MFEALNLLNYLTPKSLHMSLMIHTFAKSSFLPFHDFYV